MKKITLSLIAVLAVSFAFSQSVEIGIKAGANFSDIKASYEKNKGVNLDDISKSFKNSNILPSFHAGVFALVKFGMIGVQPEVLYSLQGSKVEVLGVSHSEKLHYLSVPVLAKLYLPLGFNIQAGPQFAYLLDTGKKIDIKNIGSTAVKSFKDQYKSGNISVAFGAGWDTPFGLKIDARYVLGLTNIREVSASDYKIHNIQVSLGYSLFKLGK